MNEKRRGPLSLSNIKPYQTNDISLRLLAEYYPVIPYIGPKKGVFPTPDTGPFFPSDTDIQHKINVGRHRHSELVARHLTLHFSLTLTVSFPSRRRTLSKISSRRRTLRPPFMGPLYVRRGLKKAAQIAGAAQKRIPCYT